MYFENIIFALIPEIPRRNPSSIRVVIQLCSIRTSINGLKGEKICVVRYIYILKMRG